MHTSAVSARTPSEAAGVALLGLTAAPSSPSSISKTPSFHGQSASTTRSVSDAGSGHERLASPACRSTNRSCSSGALAVL